MIKPHMATGAPSPHPREAGARARRVHARRVQAGRPHPRGIWRPLPWSPGTIAATALGVALAASLGEGPVKAFGFNNDPDAYVVNYYTGGGGKVLFAAGTANNKCIPQGLPDMRVTSQTPGLRLTFSVGTFVVTGTDAGYLVCLGQPVPGVLVTGRGRGEAIIRVTYPPKGEWYEHKIRVPGP